MCFWTFGDTQSYRSDFPLHDVDVTGIEKKHEPAGWKSKRITKDLSKFMIDQQVKLYVNVSHQTKLGESAYGKINTFPANANSSVQFSPVQSRTEGKMAVCAASV